MHRNCKTMTAFKVLDIKYSTVSAWAVCRMLFVPAVPL